MKKIKFLFISFISVVGIAAALSFSPTNVYAYDYGINENGTYATYNQFLNTRREYINEIDGYVRTGKISYQTGINWKNNINGQTTVDAMRWNMTVYRNYVGTKNPTQSLSEFKKEAVNEIYNWRRHGYISISKYNSYYGDIYRGRSIQEVRNIVRNYRLPNAIPSWLWIV